MSRSVHPARRRLPAVVVAVTALLMLFLVPPGVAEARPNLPPGEPGCDPIDAAACLLPFPNDWFTKADRRTDTGRRVAFTSAMLPHGAAPESWNRNDGFSPGSMVITRVPGLDLAASGAAPVTDIGRSLSRSAPIVVLDAETGERVPYWAELDANATDPARRALLVHPARSLVPGHRYLVGLRNLRGADHRVLAAPEAFAKIAGRRLSRHDPLAARQTQLRPVLDRLDRAGVDRRDLYLAWDFTVASERNLTGGMLRMRDEAFGQLGDAAPRFTVTGVKNTTPAQDPRIAREVTGTVTVPSYLDQPGGPTGSTLNLGRDGLPRQLPGNTQTAQFRCEIPHAAFEKPSQASLYGHGLLGSNNEVGSGNVKAMANEHDLTFCATKWIGMADEDLPTVARALADIGTFGAVPDRTQQGFLNALFLGRDMIHARGFSADPAFRTDSGRPLIDIAKGLVYDGNSQGGILGGSLLAVSQDAERGVLGVTGMNYSLLLNRSSDFGPYGQILDAAHPDKLDQQVVLSLFQMLRDRGETNGYASGLDRTPLPRTPRHRVLMQVAFGDHQVTNLAAEIEARTIGARVHEPAIAAGRNPDRDPYWGIGALPRGPYRGSALVVWDSGTPAPPLTNTPPIGPEYGRDPHSDPRNSPVARLQKAEFLATGRVIDVCGGAPCTAPAG
ncbi:hypothetical protein [Streptomyces sp. SID3343]|uniref:hypothetical protein n=1 Tax=Streptomyces sp. SID3343 TaxID=2690260 RepID=UPI00136D4721|nr:hypothetical protein [Streptomyces sp. SID3343]